MTQEFKYENKISVKDLRDVFKKDPQVFLNSFDDFFEINKLSKKNNLDKFIERFFTYAELEPKIFDNFCNILKKHETTTNKENIKHFFDYFFKINSKKITDVNALDLVELFETNEFLKENKNILLPLMNVFSTNEQVLIKIIEVIGIEKSYGFRFPYDLNLLNDNFLNAIKKTNLLKNAENAMEIFVLVNEAEQEIENRIKKNNSILNDIDSGKENLVGHYHVERKEQYKQENKKGLKQIKEINVFKNKFYNLLEKEKLDFSSAISDKELKIFQSQELCEFLLDKELINKELFEKKLLKHVNNWSDVVFKNIKEDQTLLSKYIDALVDKMRKDGGLTQISYQPKIINTYFENLRQIVNNTEFRPDVLPQKNNIESFLKNKKNVFVVLPTPEVLKDLTDKGYEYPLSNAIRYYLNNDFKGGSDNIIRLFKSYMEKDLLSKDGAKNIVKDLFFKDNNFIRGSFHNMIDVLNSFELEDLITKDDKMNAINKGIKLFATNVIYPSKEAKKIFDELLKLSDNKIIYSLENITDIVFSKMDCDEKLKNLTVALENIDFNPEETIIFNEDLLSSFMYDSNVFDLMKNKGFSFYFKNDLLDYKLNPYNDFVKVKEIIASNFKEIIDFKFSSEDSENKYFTNKNKGFLNDISMLINNSSLSKKMFDEFPEFKNLDIKERTAFLCLYNFLTGEDKDNFILEIKKKNQSNRKRIL